MATTAEDKGSILVVDDEPNARAALAELLRGEGYRFETAADGFKALGKLEDGAPDLVLTDLKMPGMGGVELLEKVRTLDEEVVVLVMTAFGAVESAVDAMKKGAADYLTKPLNTAELFLVVAREMERRRLRRESGNLRARLESATASTTSSAAPPPCRPFSRPSLRWPGRGPASSSRASRAPARS